MRQLIALSSSTNSISKIYPLFSQRYEIYLQKPIFKNILPDVKDFLKNVFKKYDEKLNYQIKDNFANRQPSFFYD